MAGRWNFTVHKGTYVDRTLTWKRDGAAVDLTGFSAHMQIRQVPGGTVLEDLSTTNGRITLGGTAGTIRVTIPAADTAAWTFTSARYDLVLTDTAGNPDVLLEGRVLAKTTVTAP